MQNLNHQVMKLFKNSEYRFLKILIMDEISVTDERISSESKSFIGIN